MEITVPEEEYFKLNNLELILPPMYMLPDESKSMAPPLVELEPLSNCRVHVVFTLKESTLKLELEFPAESMTIIVQSEYSASLRVLKEILLSPALAEVVEEEQEPP